MPQLQNNSFCIIGHMLSPKHNNEPVKASHNLWLEWLGIYKVKLYI